MPVLENLNKFVFPEVGRYGIPAIAPVTALPQGDFIPANYHYTERCPEGKNIHFFLDDAQLARYWNHPDRYLPKLDRFRSVLAPDFSTYTDMPPALQIYNHYRKHWLAAYWQAYGITVYPTISWSTPESFSWCFDGEPAGGIVAVSSVGTQKDRESRRLFLLGYQEMMHRLSPAGVIFYGRVPEECCGIVLRLRPHYDSIKERQARKWAAEEQAAE